MLTESLDGNHEIPPLASCRVQYEIQSPSYKGVNGIVLICLQDTTASYQPKSSQTALVTPRVPETTVGRRAFNQSINLFLYSPVSQQWSHRTTQ